MRSLYLMMRLQSLKEGGQYDCVVFSATFLSQLAAPAQPMCKLLLQKVGILGKEYVYLCMKKYTLFFVPFKTKGNSVPHDAVAK
jgi:hypothetical protein